MADLREVVAPFKKSRFGRFLADGSFEEVTDPSKMDDDCRWVGGHQDGQLVDAVLAALAGRIAPEVEGDVVEEAAVIIAKEHGHCGQFLASQVANAVAAATERRVREECARVADEAKAWHESQNPSGHDGFESGGASAAEEIASRIRTGAAS